MTAPEPGLRRAFLSSSYGTASQRACLSAQPGVPPAWARGHWGIVTAWNPAGQQADRAVNAAEQAKLERRVRRLGFTFLGGTAARAPGKNRP